MSRDSHSQWPSLRQSDQSFRESESRCRLVPRAHHLRDTADRRVETESPSPARSSVPEFQIEKYQRLLRKSESYVLRVANQALEILLRFGDLVAELKVMGRLVGLEPTTS